MQNAPAQLKRRTREAHATGPVPPNVEALRDRTFDTLKRMAELVEDPIFVLLGEFTLDVTSFEQTRDYLRTELYSDDTPDGFDPRAFKALTPLAVGVSDDGDAAAPGSAEFWRRHSGRVDEFAERIGDFAAYLARHCSDYA
eukprot:9492474-Pyramimonas_sp.AAC.1